jgi:transcriptional regulator with XRE-family HTH domain
MEPRHNYIRACRKQAGLSQQDLAYLFGSDTAMSISRYERNYRLPRIDAVLGLQIALGVSSKDLFPDLYQQVEKNVIQRTRELLHKLRSEQKTDVIDQKIKALKAILLRDSTGSSNA